MNKSPFDFYLVIMFLLIYKTYEQIGFLGFWIDDKMIIPFLERKNRFGKGKYLFYNQ